MAEDMRSVLLGMNNPLSRRPEHALFPYPPGCTGHRIFEMLSTKIPDIYRKDYLDGFERVNMLTGSWSMRRARERAPELVERFRGRTVVVLGQAPRLALGLPEQLVHPLDRDGVSWRQLPHPSGRNRWYNDPKNREIAASLLAELFLRGQRETDKWRSTSRCSEELTRT